ncbi:MAG: hypothetical protein D6748_02690 [Calditrichaeota bacterium]|nr:MAG: hypothetical protein D6748_02690 [Calditrichota bacterium]
MKEGQINLAVVFLLFYPLFLFSQPASTFQVTTQKDFISWNWNGLLQSRIATGESSSLDIKNVFRSTLFQQSNQTDKWRDENTLQLSWEHPINNWLNTRTFLNSRILSDENAFVDFSKHLGGQEFSLKLLPHLQVTPALGWTVEDAFNIQDQGWYSHLGLSINQLDLGGYLNNTELKNVLRSFPDRKNQEFTFATRWFKRFSPYATDSLRLGYQYSENRYYINPTQFTNTIDHPQEQVIINSRFLNNQLQYNISPHSALAILTTLKNRHIDQSNPAPLSNKRKEISLENQIQYLLTLGTVQFQIGAFFSQVSNDNPELRTDISVLQSAFNSRLRYQPGRKHLTWLQFSYTKLEYNTPEVFLNERDRNTRDDRDELRFIMNGGYQHRFSDYFSASIFGNVYLFHQIYLRSGRSANNNWNRIYQMGAHFQHILSSRFSHRYQLKILANYTAFDFDNLLPQLRSFVFRKLIYTDSLKFQLTDNLSLGSIYQYQKEDNGTFFKDIFAQQITKELESHFLSVLFQHQGFLGLQISSGVSLFFRKEWGYFLEPLTGDRKRQRTRNFHSISPRLTITYPASKRLLLFLNYAPNRSVNRTYSRQVPGEVNETVDYFSSGTINLQYLF